MIALREKIWAWLATNALLIVAIFAALASVGFVVQTIRIDGFQIDLPFIGSIGPKGLLAERDEARATVAAMLRQREDAIRNSKRVAAANTAATEKANTDEERYAEIDRADAERFIAANRVRPCPAARADTTAPGDGAERAAAGSDLPILDDRLPEGLVSVPEGDIRICTENTRRLILGRDWALAIEANHASTEPVEP
jgi:hypothetical protein